METETNFKIYNTLQQLEQGSLGGGSGPPPGSVTGGPGGSIANGTITNINIAQEQLPEAQVVILEPEQSQEDQVVI